MATVDAIAPNRGTPYGGQTVTITGTGFGVALPVVTIEGRSCLVTANSDTSITAVTPARRAADLYIWGGGDVDLVVAPAAGLPVTVAMGYEYIGTIAERAFTALRASLASLTVQDGAFFNWSPAQVRPVKLDQLSLDSGAEFPQAIVYEIDGTSMVEQSAHGFLTMRHNGVMQAIYPLARMEDWDLQLDQILADLHRGLMLDSSQGGTVISTDITGFDKGRIGDQSDGAAGVASLTFTLEIQTAYNDFTRNNGYTVT